MMATIVLGRRMCALLRSGLVALLGATLTVGTVRESRAQGEQPKTLFELMAEVARLGQPLLIPADDVEGEAIATLVVNRLRPGGPPLRAFNLWINVDGGFIRPAKNPGLGNAQSLELGSGFFTFIGPAVAVPAGTVPWLGPVDLTAGIDALFLQLPAQQVRNNAGGAVPATGEVTTLGAMPNVGVAVRLPSGWQFTADVGFGFVRNRLQLSTAVPVVDMTETTSAWRLRIRTLLPLTDRVAIGAVMGYLATGTIDGRTNAGGPISLSNPNFWYAGITLAVGLPH